MYINIRNNDKFNANSSTKWYQQVTPFYTLFLHPTPTPPDLPCHVIIPSHLSFPFVKAVLSLMHVLLNNDI